MRIKEKSIVIFTLKFFELILCSLCLSFHIVGIHHDQEPLPHDVLSCGIFFAFILHALIGCLGIVLNVATPLLLDAIVDSIASALFLIVAIISMVHAENDDHLMFLTDDEEVNHPFFVICRRQSVYSLVTSTMFGMHASIDWDMFFIAERVEESVDEARQPIQLHFLPFRFCVWLGNRTDNAYIAAILKHIDSTSVPPESRVNPNRTESACNETIEGSTECDTESSERTERRVNWNVDRSV